MSNPSSWFGIHAHDLDRAKAFYESVFDKPLQDVGGNGFRFIISQPITPNTVQPA